MWIATAAEEIQQEAGGGEPQSGCGAGVNNVESRPTAEAWGRRWCDYQRVVCQNRPGSIGVMSYSMGASVNSWAMISPVIAASKTPFRP